MTTWSMAEGAEEGGVEVAVGVAERGSPVSGVSFRVLLLTPSLRAAEFVLSSDDLTDS